MGPLACPETCGLALRARQRNCVNPETNATVFRALSEIESMKKEEEIKRKRLDATLEKSVVESEKETKQRHADFAVNAAHGWRL